MPPETREERLMAEMDRALADCNAATKALQSVSARMSAVDPSGLSIEEIDRVLDEADAAAREAAVAEAVMTHYESRLSAFVTEGESDVPA